MSTNCDRCGYRDNEVKSGAAISPQGKRITLKVEDREDLSRDILKVRGSFVNYFYLCANHVTERVVWAQYSRD